ncbi:MAG: DDE-type integrase/transposase/recombinase [Bacteriovoracaceae bacterium]|nr:DDE-type integrase/transposase/recombinase [Bacteriovoracaceae bacterium]
MQNEKRYPKKLTEKIGKMLLEKRGLPQKKLASSLGVSSRTLRNWKRKALEGRSPKIGRPTYTTKQRRNALILVSRELKRQGNAGGPAVYSVLKGKVQRRLVNEFVARIKARERKIKSEFLKHNRTSIQVLRKDVIWSQDGTHIGRLKGKAIEAQVIKDRATLKTVGIQVGVTATEKDVLNQLQDMKKARALPLVWMTDNGSAYIGKELKEFLRDEQVVHLKSVPRVPQHNAAAERAMYELKKASLLGKMVVLESINEGFERITKAAETINACRPRMSKGYKTAKELEVELKSFHDKIDRETFYLMCMKELNLIDERHEKRCAVMMKRNAVFTMLSELELININRGVRGNV